MFGQRAAREGKRRARLYDIECGRRRFNNCPLSQKKIKQWQKRHGQILICSLSLSLLSLSSFRPRVICPLFRPCVRGREGEREGDRENNKVKRKKPFPVTSPLSFSAQISVLFCQNTLLFRQPHTAEREKRRERRKRERRNMKGTSVFPFPLSPRS